eukprot:115611_1
MLNYSNMWKITFIILLLVGLLRADVILKANTISNNAKDQLHELFLKHNRLDIKWYNKLLNAGLDYNDLMDSTENDLRSLLINVCQLSEIQAVRIINTVRKISTSVIYKQFTKTKISIISPEEQQTAKNIQLEIDKINDNISNVQQELEQLYIDLKINKQFIHNKFKDIMNIIEKRKNEQLAQLQINYDQRYHELHNLTNLMVRKKIYCAGRYDEIQNWMRDTTMGISIRRENILAKNHKCLMDTKERKQKSPFAPKNIYLKHDNMFESDSANLIQFGDNTLIFNFMKGIPDDWVWGLRPECNAMGYKNAFIECRFGKSYSMCVNF